ncbi:alpha/beta hydrolase [Planctomycetota bacterium]|nr:alpha/beta hydrolase [Planctomycetota bacterium]
MEISAAQNKTERVTVWANQAIDALPSLSFYPAEKKNGLNATVLIFPGGGYVRHADHEGVDVAKAANEYGFDAAVLKCRVSPTRHPEPLNDAQRAMRMIKVDGEKYGVCSEKVAVLGFSAGGHLASMMMTMWDECTNEEDDLKDVCARPDAGVLCYAVIDMVGESSHGSSCKELLGEGASEAARAAISTHLRVREDGPAGFVWHTMTDGSVNVKNAMMFGEACCEKGVAVEMHVFEEGRHGLGLAEGDESIGKWFDLAMKFLERHLK